MQKALLQEKGVVPCVPVHKQISFPVLSLGDLSPIMPCSQGTPTQMDSAHASATTIIGLQKIDDTRV